MMTVLADIEFDEVDGPAASQEPQGGEWRQAGGLAVLLTFDDALAHKVASALSQTGLGLRTVHSNVSGFESAAAYPVAAPSLLIADLDSAAPADMEALERIKASRFASTPLIVISRSLDQDTVRKLVQIRVDDWLPRDCPELDITKSCVRLRQGAQAPEPEHDAACYSFLPVSGGVGNTTLAIQTAFILARKATQPAPVCIVDLNFQDGSVADYLDLTPAFKIEELSADPGRLDRQLLDVMLSRHSSGISVLAAPRLPGRHLEVSGVLVGSVLGLLSKCFGYLVVDLPKSWQAWTGNVLWGSNKIFIVAPFTVPGLHQARDAAGTIIAKASATTDVSVIINRFHEPIFGGGLLRKDAERVLGPRLGGFIPEARAAVTEAINRGLPVSEAGSGKKLEKRLAEILGYAGAAAKNR